MMNSASVHTAETDIGVVGLPSSTTITDLPRENHVRPSLFAKKPEKKRGKRKLTQTGQDLLAYSNAQIDTGLARLPPINPDPDLYPQLSYQGSITQHIKLLQCARKALHAISTDPQLQTPSTPTLFPDIQKRNILVSESDPSIVTAILEWKQAAIEPAFWYANLVPDFAHRAAGRPIPNEPLQKGEDEEEYERDELCAKTYRDVMRGIPKLNMPRDMHENIFRLYWVCVGTWERGLPSLHHELIELRKDWERLGFSGVCPYPEPSEEEIERHKKEYEDMKVTLGLKQLLCDTLCVQSDGWLVEENWDAVQEVHKDLYEKFLDVAKNVELEEGEERMEERDVRVMWPFDIPV